MASLCVSFVLVLVSVAFGDDLSELSREKRLLDVGNTDVPDEVLEQLNRSELLLTTPEFVTKYGYPVETHTVTTEDGYLLSVHRIPGSPKSPPSSNKKVVLLQHGQGAASDCFVLMGPERGMAFLLADEGYDVWMGNVRGNRYSRKHVSISARNFTFYNYTWHEMGYYDLPAIIDHVLQTTQQDKLFYIGHSMGGTIFFVLTTTRPEYNKKIRLGVMMAPGVFLEVNQRSITLLLRPYAQQLYQITKRAEFGALGIGAEIPLARLIVAACGDGKPFQPVCLQFYFYLFGYNPKQFNSTMLPSIIAHGVTGNTVNLQYHFAQLVYTDRFQMFDRSGRWDLPTPEYDLSKVTAPVSVHYAQNDQVVPPGAVVRLSKQVPNLVKLVKLTDDTANHNDFIFSIHIKELVINEILDLMRQY